MSVNPEKIIQKVEFGTSHLANRVQAINKLKKAGYIVDIIIALIILKEKNFSGKKWENTFQVIK